MSSCSVRGYLSKSSLGPNCRRLTKIDATTGSPCWCAICISDRCAACRLPIVGTKATRFCPRSWSRSSSIDRTTFIALASPGRCAADISRNDAGCCAASGGEAEVLAPPAHLLDVRDEQRVVLLALDRVQVLGIDHQQRRRVVVVEVIGVAVGQPAQVVGGDARLRRQA